MKAISKDFVREIKNTKSRFFSIMILVCLAVAFLSGLKATAPDMKITGHNYFEQQKLADVQILSTVGLTDEDLEAVLSLEEVEDAECCYVIDAFATSSVTDRISKVYSIPEKEINKLLLMDGRMPEKKDECVVEEKALSSLNISIGDKIRLTPQESFSKELTVREFTVTGTVRSPIYVSVERGSASIGTGSVSIYMAIPKECFDSEAYTTIFARLKKTEDMTAFSDAYDDYVEDFIDSIEAFGNERAEKRYDSFVKKLDDAQAELDDAREEADTKLSDADKKLKDADRTIRDGKKEIADADIKIADAETEISDGEKELEDAYTELTDGEKKYFDGILEYEDGYEEYEDGLKEYEDGLKEYEDGLKEYEDGYRQWLDGRSQWETAGDQLSQASALLDAQAASVAAAQAGLDLAASRMTENARTVASQAAFDATSDAAVAQAAAASVTPYTAEDLYNLAQTNPSMLGGTADSIIQAYEGVAAYNAGRAQIAAGQQQLDWAYDDIIRGGRELKEAKKELDDAEEELSDARAELDDAETELADAKTEILDARTELDEGWAEYYDGKKELSDAVKKLSDAKTELSDARIKLADGERDYLSGKQEYEDAKAEAEEKISDAQKKIDDARDDLNDIKEVKWYIFSRSYNPGYSGLGQDADRMGNLAKVFPVIFFLVAALVCLTTMTRMVEEQRIQIGGLKALGYSRLAISGKYIGYGLLPSLAGSILGLAIGFSLFPSMIFTAYQIMYQMPDIEIHVYSDICTGCILAGVLCTMAATLAACLATLKDTPANLMRPKSPQAGKRVFLEYIGFIWKKLKFIHKVTARNLFRYKKRFWMTVIGIGGCTALIIAGFGLRYSLTYTMYRQYDELLHYDAQISISDTIEEKDKKAIEEYLESDDRITGFADLKISAMNAVSDARTMSIYLYAIDADELPVYADIFDYETGEMLHLSDDGIYIDQKLSELLDVGIGDEIFLDGDDKAYVRVAGIFEHYTGHFCYMTPACYENTFGKEYISSGAFLLLESDDDAFCDSVFEDLMSLEGVAGTSRMLDVKDTYLRSMERIDFVVVIVILSAGALAMVVLYNLSNINITERKRELATIKVLGFYDGEVSSYVYRENIVLTVFGIAAGIILGHYLHTWLIVSVEIDMMMFGRETDPMSYVWAAGLTVLFSVIANVIAHYKMKKIDMVESLKSAE